MSTTQKSTMVPVLLSSMAMIYNQRKPVSINVAQMVALSAPTFPLKNAIRFLIHKTDSFQMNPTKHNLSDLYPANFDGMGKPL